ncbi:choice-of-anchor Q domain-containing protein [Telluria sp. Tellsp104]
MLTLMTLLGMPAVAAPLTIKVIGVDTAGTRTEVKNFRWTVEQDVTKDSVPGQHATRDSYSFSFHASYMPVVATGKMAEVGGVATQQTGNDCSDPASVACLDPDRKYMPLPDLDPARRYYVSILPDDGYAMGGVAIPAGATTATVYVNKYPLPAAQLSIFVFNDNSPLNGAPDLPQEQGLAGFTILLTEAGGTYGASGGQVTQDAFGNPLGTTYKTVCGAGETLTAGYCYSGGKPVMLTRGSGIIMSGPDGVAVIRNLFPAKYTVQVIPPTGTDWHQTTTIEGTKGDDAWVRNGEPPFFQEFGPPGHHVFTGFTHSGILAKNGTTPVLNGGAAITGKVVNIHNSRPPDYSFHDGIEFPGCWVGLNEATGTRRALYAAACNADSTFSIPNVPPGTWELVVWDEAMDVIIATAPVTVPAAAATVALGNVPVFNWFARYEGRVFYDANGDGFPDAGEVGIANQALNIRFRDGSIYQSTLTNSNGEFKFNEFFPFFNWMIGEVDYARFKATGATIVVDAGGEVPKHNGWATPSFNRLTPQIYTCTEDDVAANTAKSPNLCLNAGDTKPYRVEQGVVLLEGMQAFLGQTNHIEWGKKAYSGQENGGIAGIVQYGITRAEDDPKYATAENWEPGIPRVQVNLFLDCDGDGKPDKPAAAADGSCAGNDATALSSKGYVYDAPDVDNYPFCWRDPASCGLDAPRKGPEDVKRSAAGGDAFSYGDVFRWGSDPDNDGQPYVGLGKTDGWDDAIPTECPGERYKVPYGLDAGKPLDCYDGLRNWNQARPAVFDGGYAFGSVAGQSNLPNKKYIVEAVAPPGYFHQGNGDKNVVFGDQLTPTPNAEPFACVGRDLPVPPLLTLFPAAGQTNPLYKAPGQTWKKCDMKLVDMQPGRNPAPNFFLFTEAPVAGHGVGFILDDLSSEFDVNAPTFGEKHAPPHLPVSLLDWSGKEIGRVYADEFGSFNFLVPSTFTINPPFPSGVSPSMITSCMNSPGPIPDPGGALNADGSPKLVIDPYFDRRYSQFCYTFQYLPGKTTYLDTPVVPVAAFAGPAQNPLDCEFGDSVPMIYSVTGNGNSGPWVPASGNRTLTIVSAGKIDVLNPYYDPNDGSQRLIKRDFGFGASDPASKVLLGNVALPVTSWSNDVIVATVPATATTGQLTVVRAGVSSPVGLTVTVGGRTPKYVPAGGSIQAVIDAPTTADGDLIIVPPGIYNTPIIMDKKVQLQGWGAMSTMINAAKLANDTLKKWRVLLDRKIDARPASPPVIDPDTGVNTLNAGPNRTFDLLPGQALGGNLSDNEPILFGADEAPGILVVGKSSATGSGNGHFNATNPARIDGLTITGADGGGGIIVSGYGRNVQIANNRIVGNSGTYSGGIRIGHVDLMDQTNTAYGGYTDSVDPNVNIHHNWVVQNGGTEAGAGGGIGIGNGASNYQIVSNYVCGNFSLGHGGGIGQLGLANGGTIANNTIIFNQNFNQSASTTGGGVFLSGPAPINAGARSAGAGSVSLVQNLIQGNNAGAGAGGGVRLAQINGLDVERAPNNDNAWNTVTMVNNIIVDNVSGYAGGGVSIVDALKVNAANNTIAFNDTTATTQEAFSHAGDPQSSPQPAGLVVHRTSDGLLAAFTNANRRNQYRFSNPNLVNNILWHNRAGCWAITGSGAGEFGLFDPNASGGCDINSPMGTHPVYVDLAVLGTAAQGTFAGKYVGSGVDKLAPDHSILSDLLGSTGYANNGNLAADPQFVAQYASGDRKPSPFIPGFSTTIDTAATSDEGGNFIDVRFGPLTPWNCLNSDGSVKSPQSAANCTPFGNYHLKPGSPAIDTGLNRTGANGVPAADFDGDARPVNKIDIGADEVGAAPPPDLPAPTVGLLDDFNRANAPTLGSKWRQLTLLGQASLRVNNQAASAALLGSAFWTASFGAKQAAAMTFPGTPADGAALVLKGNGTFTLGTYPSYVRVRYSGGAILVDTTTNGGLGFANLATVNGSAQLAAGDTLLAQCDAAGVVGVWRVRAGTASFLGSAALPATSPAGASGGQIGMTLPLNARVDDFGGGNVP